MTPESRRVPQRPPFTDYRQSRKVSEATKLLGVTEQHRCRAGCGHRRHACRSDGPDSDTTPGAALRYQHAVQDHDRVTADALSKLVAGDVTPIKAAKRTKSKSQRAHGVLTGGGASDLPTTGDLAKNDL